MPPGEWLFQSGISSAGSIELIDIYGKVSFSSKNKWSTIARLVNFDGATLERFYFSYETNTRWHWMEIELHMWYDDHKDRLEPGTPIKFETTTPNLCGTLVIVTNN